MVILFVVKLGGELFKDLVDLFVYCLFKVFKGDLVMWE